MAEGMKKRVSLSVAGSGAKNIEFLQDALYAQIGATPVLDAIDQEAEQEPEPPTPASPKKSQAPARGQGGTSR